MTPDTPQNVKDVCLYAWLGEDELGSGEVGIKQGRVPAGMIPIVSVSDAKVSQDFIIEALQAQVNAYGKTIRLCKFTFAQEIITIEPDK